MSNRNVICAECKVPVEATSKPNPDTVFSCPICGVSDTQENVFGEAAKHLHEQSIETLNRSFKKIAARSKNFQFTPSRRQKRTYRFIFGD